MGWTSFKLDEPIKEWFKKEWESNSKYKVLDSALLKRTTMYGAIQNIETKEVFCAVFLVRWSREYYNFSYKDMTEFAGPNECECPERIMKLLTVLNDTNDSNGWAREWRKRCKETILNRKKMKTGNYVIKTNEPVNFTSGASYQYFKKIGKRMYAGIINGDNMFNSICHVRLNLKHFNHELIPCV